MSIRKAMLLTVMTMLAITLCHAEETGKWTIFRSYANISDIQPTEREIYVLASGGLYGYNTSDNSLTTYDRTTCLNGTDIQHIAWSEETQRLMITYSDQNIDILDRKGETLFINDLANKQISGDKTIFSIYIYDKFAFLSTGFGIVKVDMQNAYIADSYILGFAVEYCYIEGDNIYAVSETEGTYKASMSENLLDKGKWEKTGDYAPQKKEQYTYDRHHNCYWAGDNDGMLVQYREENGKIVPVSSGVKPDGPKTDECWKMYWHDNKLYITAGNYSYNIYKRNPGCVMIFDGTQWDTVETPSKETVGFEYRNANCIAFDTKDKNHFYVGSHLGVLEFYDNKFVEGFNSFTNADNETKRIKTVSSMTFDEEGNLWLMNGWNNVPIVSRKTDGTWVEYPHDNNRLDNMYGVDIQGTFISKTNGYLWNVNLCASTSALFRYDYKNDVLTDYKEFYNQDGTKLSLPYLYQLAEDKKGNLWVVTKNGPMYLSKYDIEKGNFVFTQHKVPRNDGTNYADYLLDGVETRCITIDDANRKWIGTTGNGVFLISDDCNTQEEHFTTENSPILSNHVYDIKVDPNTGIVYFSTEKGICAYQGENTTTNDNMTTDNVRVFPNPVTPEYTGKINVTGLSMNSDIKITTASGALVNQGTSRGGSYSWDGCDVNGNPVASGVYMINVAKEDGSKGVVVKVAIVR